MSELQVFNLILLISFLSAAAIFTTLFFFNAPYGRHLRQGWGLVLPNRLAWILMEAPSSLVFIFLFIIGSTPRTVTAWIFLIIWQSHYIHRAFIYPFSLKSSSKKMPVLIMLMGILFNTGNAYLNARFLFHFSPVYPTNWLWSMRFIAGSAIFILGYVINRWADQALKKLRKPGESGYKIPYGGLFRYVSCPNYLGEIIEWLGWAVCTWSIAGLSFAVWTFANLAPRAQANHEWYLQNFPHYPRERRVLFPWVW